VDIQSRRALNDRLHHCLLSNDETTVVARGTSATDESDGRARRQQSGVPERLQHHANDGLEGTIGERRQRTTARSSPISPAREWPAATVANDESAGKRRSGRSRKGSRWLGIALTEAAQANTRSRDGYLSAQYRRLKPRRGHKKAIGADRHSIIVAAWHMLSTGEIYRDAGGDYFTRLDPDKQTRRLLAQLERLGHVVTLQNAAA